MKDFFIFLPVIFIISALPVSVGGWGVQEGAYAYFFGRFAQVDSNQAIALSILYKLSLIIVSLPGGLVFAIGKGQGKESRVDGIWSKETPESS